MSAPQPQIWHYVADCDAIPVREGRRVRVSERELALFNLGDRFAAIDNACPHRQGPLADGIVAGTAVFCPLHAWKICLETGIPLAGGEGHVNSHQTKLVGRKIYVALAGTTHDATQGVR